MCASTRHTNMFKRGRSWLGVDRRGHRSSMGVDCDILSQGLIGLIEYSYYLGIPSFSQACLQRTLRLRCLILSNLRMGDQPGCLLGCVQVGTKVRKKD
jgi:hypothetical protein